MGVRSVALTVLILFAGSGIYAQIPKFLYGIIGVFGDDYAGKIMASGETYDPDKLTVAHPSLPFGTEIEIENLENGKKIRAKVADRGPLAGSRLLDVSRKSAETLGFLRKGTVYAKVGVIRMGDNKVKDVPVTQAGASSSTPAVSVTPTAPAAAPVVPSATTTVVVQTNMQTLYQTNAVDITNYMEVSITNTNIMEIPPYEDKFIELPVEERDTGKSLAVLKDEFIMDEPGEDKFPAATPGLVELPLVTPPAIEPDVVPVPVETPEIPVPSTNISETLTEESQPESLLSNEEAVNLEKMESQGEAVLESSFQKGNFAVQAGAFRKESNALRFYDRLRDKGYRVFSAEATIRGRKWFRVRIGYFQTLKEAKSVLQQLKGEKIKGFIVNIKK